jgi:hypothetical protein
MTQLRHSPESGNCFAQLIRSKVHHTFAFRLEFWACFNFRLGGDWRLWRLGLSIARQFRWPFVVPMAWVHWTLVLCVLIVMSACNISFVDKFMFPFHAFMGCAARIRATSFYCSSLYFGFLSSRRFATWQSRCNGIPNVSRP